MGFLSGRVTFDRLQVQGTSPRQLGEQHIKLLEKYAIGESESVSAEAPAVGFLAGKHLFDLNFDLEKNVVGEALHAAIRIDVSKVPGPLRKAWLEMELAVLAAESPNGRVTRAMRQEAKEAVQARCDEELRSGKFKRMQQIPFLWDVAEKTVYCGSSSPAVQEHLRALFESAFDLSLTRVSAGTLAEQLAETKDWTKAFEKLAPSQFSPDGATEQLDWLSERPECADYLGNEWLLWLWWWLETQADSIELPDGTTVTGMLVKTLSLQCPRGETGKETISAEAPAQLPEAFQAVRSGKLPRRVGMTLVRDGETYELSLQVETLSVSGAAIESGERDRGRNALEERIASIRRLSETIDLLFEAFCARRLGRKWTGELEQIQKWLEQASSKPRKR